MGELGDGLFGVGGGGVPAFFGFEAGPGVVIDGLEGGDAAVEGEVAFAEEFGVVLVGGAEGVFEVGVADVFGEAGGGVFGLFAAAEGVFDVPDHADVVGGEFVEEFEDLVAGGPGVVGLEEGLAVERAGHFY